MNQREDYEETKNTCQRLYQESGQAHHRLHPRERVRMRPDQTFAWHDEGSERVDRKTGWKWYDFTRRVYLRRIIERVFRSCAGIDIAYKHRPTSAKKTTRIVWARQQGRTEQPLAGIFTREHPDFGLVLQHPNELLYRNKQLHLLVHQTLGGILRPRERIF